MMLGTALSGGWGCGYGFGLGPSIGVGFGGWGLGMGFGGPRIASTVSRLLPFVKKFINNK